MNGKSMVSREGEEAFELLYVLYVWMVKKFTCDYLVNEHTSASQIYVNIFGLCTMFNVLEICSVLTWLSA
jgi:hypothetical protein